MTDNQNPVEDDAEAQDSQATRTTMTITLEVDGFVGKRQAQATAENAVRQLKTVLPYDARVSADTPVSTEFSSGGQTFTDISTASQLPAPETQAPLQASATPDAYTPPGPVAPLGVEPQRGGLPDGNLEMNEIMTPVPGIENLVTSSPTDIAPSAYSQQPDAVKASTATAEAGPPPDSTNDGDYNAMTVAELRTLAAERDIQGRAEMNKAELVAALEGSA